MIGIIEIGVCGNGLTSLCTGTNRPAPVHRSRLVVRPAPPARAHDDDQHQNGQQLHREADDFDDVRQRQDRLRMFTMAMATTIVDVRSSARSTTLRSATDRRPIPSHAVV